jgi:phage terminase large subunit
MATAKRTTATRQATSPLTKSNKSAERFLTEARRLGCPADQVQRFLRAGYVPQPKQLQFHAVARRCDLPGGPTEVGMGGSRGPGKSHALLAQAALDDCQRVAGLKVLFLRKIGKQARESFEDLRLRVLARIPHEYAPSRGVLVFANGSRIVLGHFQNEKDIDQYLGLEYDLVIIEETTTLSKTKHQALRDSNRTSKANWRPRMYNSTNPGGVGHAWYKQRFIDPARRGQETDTRFIFATIDDNKFVDLDYRRKLEENTGWRLRAYRYGDWDIAAGQFFTTYRRQAHSCLPFAIPENWRVWLAMDYGFTHYTTIYLLAEGDGVIYVVDEHAERGWLPERHAQAIGQMLARWAIKPTRPWTFVAGADVFAKRGERGGTIAAEYKKLGYTLRKANDDRISGAAEVLRLLGDVDQGISPRLVIFENCARLLDCLPALEHDPNRPEDVLKWDTDDDGLGGDDPYDALRYGVMAVHRPRMRGGQVDFYAPPVDALKTPPTERTEAEIERILSEATR